MRRPRGLAGQGGPDRGGPTPDGREHGPRRTGLLRGLAPETLSRRLARVRRRQEWSHCSLVGPSILLRGRRVEVRDTKNRGHRVVPRPLEPPFPGGPDSSSATRRSVPQGPCLPAGPPELLLGLFREGSAVHAASITHLDWMMQVFPRNLRHASVRWYISAVPRHRRSRRSRPHLPVALSAAVLAVVASLGLATIAPPTSSGALQPVAARVLAWTPLTATAQPVAPNRGVAGI